jgi:gluconokinase
MSSAVILALDIGTSSTRSAIYDTRGNRLLSTTTQIEYGLVTSSDGKAELRSVDVQRAVDRAFAKTLIAWKKMKSSARIEAIGVSCFWHSLLGLDQNGTAITPIYTWADSRSRVQARSLRKNRGENSLHARTGCMARTSFWPAKLLWLRKTQPHLFRRVARWVSPAEWIQQRWCGRATVSLSMASGTGLLDGHTLTWSRSLLRRCHITPNRLNTLSDHPAPVSKRAARRFPELANVPWYPAIGDGVASNLGSGATAPGTAAINVGTSAALRIMLESAPAAGKPLAPPGLFCYRVDAKRRLLGGAVSNAGNLHAWAFRELNLPAHPDAIEKLLAKRMMPSDNLTLLPFWIAERAPTWPEDLPSVVMGLTQASSAIDILQALQEATFHRLAQIAAEIEKAVKRKLAFIVSGGIHRSPSALRRLANILGRPVYVSREPEASLRGAACFVLEKLGSHPSRLQLHGAIRPDPQTARAYQKARERQMQLEIWLKKL